MERLHDVSTIETPEQIELELQLAGIGSRMLAYLIDFLWQLIPIIAAIVLAVTMLPEKESLVHKGADGNYEASAFGGAIVSLVLFAVNFFYFAAFEAWWKGQTPGKRKMGLRVVRDGGHPLDGRSALVRNFLRAVDVLPAFYLVGVVALFLSRD